jgi:hypothetical protein
MSPSPRSDELTIVPLTPELHQALVARPLRHQTLKLFGADAAAEARHCNEYGYAVTVDGFPVAAGGLVPYWEGHAEAWLILADACAPRMVLRILTAARRRLDRWQTLPHLARIQMFVRADARWRNKFGLMLGMTCEGVHRRWGPDGADYECWARVAPRYGRP